MSGFFLHHISPYKSFLIKASLLFLLLFTSACEDNGCIEADDFGDYEQQILTISSNTRGESCDYDPGVSYEEQVGRVLKNCLITGSKTISDAQGVTVAGDPLKGCKGFTFAEHRNICVEVCRQNCLDNALATPGSSEPSWVATKYRKSGSNSGVTITPGSAVTIKATGHVVLGDNKNSPDIYVLPDKGLLQSQALNTNRNQVLDVKIGESKNLRFSGKWFDKADVYNGTSLIESDYTVGDYNLSDTNGEKTKSLEELARRTVIYLLPHPPKYFFNINLVNPSSENIDQEKAGTDGVPLLPDPDLWECTYSANGNSKESSCSSRSYRDNGYTRASSDAHTNIYQISSANISNSLGLYGGIIRTADDGLGFNSSNPFNNSNGSPKPLDCNSNGCTLPENSTGGQMLMPATESGSEITITNSKEYSYQQSFKTLHEVAGCESPNITFSLKNSGDVKFFPTVAGTSPITLSSIGWSTDRSWSLEPGDKIIINSLTNSSAGANCAKFIAVKFDKILDITMQKSGLVSFKALDPSSSGCTLKGRIVNPKGDRNNFTIINALLGNTDYEADFYEYNTTTDPFSNISVTGSGWSGHQYVRKGQKIRLYPDSWINTPTNTPHTWSTLENYNRECGIGMAMKIKERPALLCRGRIDDKIPNPKCFPNGSGGCSYSLDCLDKTKATIYCPHIASGASGSSCINSWDEASCRIIDAANGIDVNRYSCQECRATGSVPSSPTSIPPELTFNSVSNCFDLENYSGKVSNISNAYLTNQTTIANQKKMVEDRGGKKLLAFNGFYGNISGFTDTGTLDGANHIYQSLQPLTFSASGRLKFLILDGDDLTAAKIGGTALDYTANNGGPIKISLNGSQEFNNGEWLEAVLCKDDNGSCTPFDTKPIPISDQPLVVSLTDDSDGYSGPKINSHFKFDDYGQLVRFVNPSAGDAPKIVGDNSTYTHCHYDGADKTISTIPASCDYETSLKTATPEAKKQIIAEVQRYKLSFKIKDPDVGNCIVSTPSATGQDDCTRINGVSPCNGLIVKNPSGATGSGVCSYSEAESGTCTKGKICQSVYYNNVGTYTVLVRTKQSSSISKATGQDVSSIANGVISPVVKIMDGSKPDANGVKSTIGQAERVYKLIVKDIRYKTIVTMCMIIMVSFYGVGYLMGVSEFSQSEVISRVIKIGIVYLFIGEQGWYWFDKFFVQLFKNGTDYLAFLMAGTFDRSESLQAAINNYDFYDKSILFSSVDSVFGIFFSPSVLKKISALLFTGLFGWAYVYIIYASFLLYVYAVANAILLYLTSQVFISILFVLGPLFFITMLFNQTKDMFDKWLSQLISFSLQQIFLLTTLAFFNMLMVEVLKMSLGYRVCFGPMWEINFITRITLLRWWNIQSMPPSLSTQSQIGNISNPQGVPSLFTILFIWVIASLMQKFITFMTDLAADLSDGIKASELGKGMADVAEKAKEAVGKGADKVWGATGGKAVNVVDRVLFDSGKTANEARKNRMNENKELFAIRKSLAGHGDKAVKQYKVDNATKLAGMSKSEQENVLKGVKNDAMKKRGQAMGLNDAKLNKALSGSGLQYEGTNVFGALAKASQQATSKGGALKTSISDKKVNTAFTKDTVSKAMMAIKTPEGKQELVDKFKEGKLEQKRNISKIAQATGKVADGAKAVKNVFHDPKYNEAKKQLEAEGKIARMAKGFSWAAPAEDKAMIAERKAQNKAATAIKTTNANISAAAHASAAAAKADAIQKGGKSDFTRDKDSLMAKVFGEKKVMTGSAEKKLVADAKARLAPEVLENEMQGLKQERSSAASDVRRAGDKKQAAINKISAMKNGNSESARDIQKIEELAAKNKAGGKLTKEEKDDVSRIKATDHFKAYDAQRAEYHSAANEERTASEKQDKAFKALEPLEIARQNISDSAVSRDRMNKALEGEKGKEYVRKLGGVAGEAASKRAQEDRKMQEALWKANHPKDAEKMDIGSKYLDAAKSNDKDSRNEAFANLNKKYPKEDDTDS